MNVPKDELRILFVDDSAVSRKLAELVFHGKPYEVVFAEGGKQALELVAHCRPDVVITDWVMPDLSGLDLCRLVRKNFKSRDTYLILLTGNFDPAQRAEGLAAGADGYLTKPLRSEELLGQLCAARSALRLRRDAVGTTP